jgi:hypothetical protein
LKSNTYPLIGSPDTATFRFTNHGPRGAIPKIIQFKLLNAGEEVPVYNLAFGDGTELLDDLVVSDNGDADKVLATVAVAAENFLLEHPSALLVATGSTPTRTRLYRIPLTRFRTVIQARFALFGILDGELEAFEPGRSYEAFMIRLLPT